MTTEPLADLDGFVDRFLSWGRAPTAEGSVALFLPDVTLRDPAADEPLTGPAIRRSIEAVLTAKPDFGLPQVRVGKGDRTALVEAASSGCDHRRNLRRMT